MFDNTWKLVAGGTALGLLAGMWDKIKAAAWRGLNLFIQRIEIPTHQAHEAVTAYLIAHYQRSRNYDRMYGAAWESHRNGRYGLVPYEQFGSRTLILWNGWFPFLYANQQEQKGNANNNQQQNHYYRQSTTVTVYSTLTYIRGTLDVEKILKEACAQRNAISWAAEDAEAKDQSRFVLHHIPKRTDGDEGTSSGRNGLAWYQQGMYRLLAHTPDQLGRQPLGNGSALDNLIFPKRVKDLIREIALWRKSRDWYREEGIPWKRGWLMYGPPGTGKTALARAFAEDLNMPIYVYNLAEIGNTELVKAWCEMQMNVPCVALIEDIDNVFHGRENVARKGGLSSLFLAAKKPDEDGNTTSVASGPLTFDCLLNCLDGVERSDGIFTIITTNDLSKIDPALGQPRTLPDGTVEFISTRPGRLDKAVELGYMEPADKKRMARRILGAYEHEYLAMLEFVDRFPDLNETPAQFQERCAQIALKCFWNEVHGPKAEAATPTVAAVAEPLTSGSA